MKKSLRRFVVGSALVATAGLSSVGRYRREGRLSTRVQLNQALEEGAVDRVRPKLMTVLTTIIGLLPVMLGTGTGSEVMMRIATPMVGGLATSTVLTLVLIPAIYAIVYKRRLESKFDGLDADVENHIGQ